MKAGNIKGALLEYIVRNLLKNCGFTNVRADGVFSFERGGQFWINGRGAAHDADIIMNPPIQMPFTYPTQLLFECKAYGTSAGLPIVRNALGLRHDLNEFEIVTRDTLSFRKNNSRAAYAIDYRTRFLYQVGVASVNGFSKPAIEFAANNKIPLLPLDWFLGTASIRNFNDIDQHFIDRFDQHVIQNLYDFLKDRDGNLRATKYRRAYEFLNSDNILCSIVTSANETLGHSYVGLLETGDMVFLSAIPEGDNILKQQNWVTSLKAEIHWLPNNPNVWILSIYRNGKNIRRTDFNFYLPKPILNRWEGFNLDKTVALDIKTEFFSKIFVFNKKSNPEVPFSIININKEWLDRARQRLSDEE